MGMLLPLSVILLISGPDLAAAAWPAISGELAADPEPAAARSPAARQEVGEVPTDGLMRVSDPHREFDFWIGEWSVQNRHLQPDGTWSTGDVTRARITPVCDGAAILEEWAGPFRGSFMNGFSLRAFDPSTQRWDLLLFWTTTGDGGFGKLAGSFRHGRGEFFAGGPERMQRYTFSDALPDSVRWDSATSVDGEQTWKTDWIMEFARTAPAAQVTEDRLFESAWTEGSLSPHARARELDWMLGNWEGIQTDGNGAFEQEARLRCKLLNKDCLVLDALEVREPGDEDWAERLSVRGYVSGAGTWESWRVSEGDTRLVRSRGNPSDGVATFEGIDPVSRRTTREVLRRLTEDSIAIEEYIQAPRGTKFEPVRFTELRRVATRDD